MLVLGINDRPFYSDKLKYSPKQDGDDSGDFLQLLLGLEEAAELLMWMSRKSYIRNSMSSIVKMGLID